MALNYNGTSPTAIKYNGTDLTVLKYGSTAVWGKPYSLSISAGANTSVTVSRTSSPNQGASTGTLSSGSVVYYGDVLKITYSVSSGYKISTHTVNGTTFNSGASFTVTSAISVVTTAVASASWKTVWTGAYYSAWGSPTGNLGQAIGVPNKVINYSYPVRFTGSVNMDYSSLDNTDETVSFTSKEMPFTVTGYYWPSASVTFKNFYGKYDQIVCTRTIDDIGVGPGSVTWTKIEQYY